MDLMATKSTKTHEKENAASVTMLFVPSRVFRGQSFLRAHCGQNALPARAAPLVSRECPSAAVAGGAVALQNRRQRVHAAANAGENCPALLRALAGRAAGFHRARRRFRG